MNSSRTNLTSTRRAHAFTLVELLVVITIIGLLVAILLPALSRARLSSQRLKQSNNLRQLAMGFLNYAADNKDTLPSRRYPWQTGEFSTHRFYSNEATVYDIDLRAPIVAYGTMAASANVIMGTPPLDDPGNSALSHNWNFSWFPGNGILPREQSPIKLSYSTAQMGMMMDFVQSSPDGTDIYATNLPGVEPLYQLGGGSSFKYNLIHDFAMIPGLYAARYDASVRWVPGPEVNYITYVNGWHQAYITP